MKPSAIDFATKKETDVAVLEALYDEGWKILSYLGPERSNFYFGNRDEDDNDYFKIRIRYLDGGIQESAEADDINSNLDFKLKQVFSGTISMSRTYFEAKYGYIPKKGVTFRLIHRTENGKKYVGRGEIVKVDSKTVVFACPELQEVP